MPTKADYKQIIEQKLSAESEENQKEKGSVTSRGPGNGAEDGLSTSSK